MFDLKNLKSEAIHLAFGYSAIRMILLLKPYSKKIKHSWKARTKYLVVYKPKSVNLLENINNIFMVHYTHLWQDWWLYLGWHQCGSGSWKVMCSLKKLSPLFSYKNAYFAELNNLQHVLEMNELIAKISPSTNTEPKFTSKSSPFNFPMLWKIQNRC